jgi:RNA polymerase sigma factor (sigma-70 family)
MTVTFDRLARESAWLNQFARHLLELPAAQLKVLLLYYVEGLTPHEIAIRLGISDVTVGWRLEQAVDDLRARLVAASG